MNVNMRAGLGGDRHQHECEIFFLLLGGGGGGEVDDPLHLSS